MSEQRIHIVIHTPPQQVTHVQHVQVMAAALQHQLVLDHRAGRHPWGSMRRDCPLCQRA